MDVNETQNGVGDFMQVAGIWNTLGAEIVPRMRGKKRKDGKYDISSKLYNIEKNVSLSQLQHACFSNTC